MEALQIIVLGLVALELLVAGLALGLVVWIVLQRASHTGSVRLPFGKKPPSLMDMPEQVQDWISRESEEWARAELRQRALELRREEGSWEGVLYGLKNTLREGPDQTEQLGR